MVKKKKRTTKKSKKSDKCKNGFAATCHCGSIYGVGFIGALVYYLSTATSFWTGFLGILKSFVWPAFLVFELLKFLGA
ncbi:MAG: hypothetical protein ACP5D2_03720 [Candidatus Nanoarchaeia archaeon]